MILVSCSIVLFYSLQWLVLRFAIIAFDLIKEAIQIAKQEGVFVSLDLASFEVLIFLFFCIPYQENTFN